MSKKGQGLPLNVIIVTSLFLLILVILAVAFIGRDNIKVEINEPYWECDDDSLISYKDYSEMSSVVFNSYVQAYYSLTDLGNSSEENIYYTNCVIRRINLKDMGILEPSVLSAYYYTDFYISKKFPDEYNYYFTCKVNSCTQEVHVRGVH